MVFNNLHNYFLSKNTLKWGPPHPGQNRVKSEEKKSPVFLLLLLFRFMQEFAETDNFLYLCSSCSASASCTWQPLRYFLQTSTRRHPGKPGLLSFLHVTGYYTVSHSGNISIVDRRAGCPVAHRLKGGEPGKRCNY